MMNNIECCVLWMVDDVYTILHQLLRGLQIGNKLLTSSEMDSVLALTSLSLLPSHVWLVIFTNSA
jgi:hypothetical protein